jgi:cell wall-associated NlpC family hydrolase
MLTTADGTGHAQRPLWWGPDVPVAPLLERPFVIGLADCWALARDWYRTEQGLTLPDFPRPDSADWWEDGRSTILEHMTQAGFVRCDDPAPDGIGLPGDGFIMQIGAGVANHVGVYLGGGIMLHHLRDRLSRREPVHRWRSHILYRVRLAKGAAA